MTTRRRGRRRRRVAGRVASLVLVGIVLTALWAVIPHDVRGAAAWVGHWRDRTDQAAEQGAARLPLGDAVRQPAEVVRVVDASRLMVQPTAAGPLARGRVVQIQLRDVQVPACYAPQATAILRQQLAPGQALSLETAPAADSADGAAPGYYLWAGQALINEQLLQAGTARLATPIPRASQYLARLEAAQTAARTHHRGLWGPACQSDPST
jgi:endonuclease YncB( thermonuclease family)